MNSPWNSIGLDNGNPVSWGEVVPLPPKESDEILRALGGLALAGAQAERNASHALHVLFTGEADTDDVCAERLQREIKGMAKTCRMLQLGVGDVSLRQVIDETREYVARIGSALPRSFHPSITHKLIDAELTRKAELTVASYVGRVLTRYDRRNDCLHALELDTSVEPHRLLRNSAPRADENPVTIDSLRHGCIFPVDDCGEVTMSWVIMCIVYELNISSLYLPTIIAAARWWRTQQQPEALR